MHNLYFVSVDKENENEASKIVLADLEEQWGVLDLTLNRDLNAITKNYIDNGDIFLIGIVDGVVICTGALISEGEDVGMIVRMSVKNNSRMNGVGTAMLQ